ncbi:MAG: ABC-type transport auxiliary lipoprotein family protein [Chthoniobacterales bacterium]
MRIARIIGIAALLCIQGCSFFYTQPKQNYFSLVAPRNSQASPSPNGAALSIDSIQINPVYENQGFTYRLEGGRTQLDYYHLFQTAPEANITEQLKIWLRKGGHFRSVSGYNQSQTSDYILSGTIETLYGDYSLPGKPVAVISMRVYVRKNNDTSSAERTLMGYYEKRIPVSNNSPEGLVSAWDKGLASIFGEIENAVTSTIH